MKGVVRNIFKLCFYISVFLVFLLSSTGYAEDPKILRMGLIPADDAHEMLRAYKPVVSYLEEKLGMKVTVQVTSDYNAAIEAMRAKHIDLAWFGPFSYVLAAEVGNGEAIARGVRRKDGRSEYHTVFVTRSETGIKTLEDLKGRTFAFVDPASTSGHLIPRSILVKNGINPEKDFKTFFYAGTHNAVGYAVQNKKVDAGATSDNTYNRMVKAGELDPKKVIIFHKTLPIPGSPITVRGGLSQTLKSRIQKAFIEMGQQTIHKVDGWGNIARYELAKDSDYNVIRETAKILGLNLKKKK